MTPGQPPSAPTIRSRGARACAGLLGAVVLAALTPASADAGLIPPPGPWPTAVAGAANPLAGTGLPVNGVHATANASLRAWLVAGRRHRTSLTRRFDRRIVIGGRLRNRGTRRSIAGAIVTLVSQNVYSPEWTTVLNTRTDRKGRFRAILPPGYHRRVAILYYPAYNSPRPVYSRRLLVRASSRVRLARPSGVGRRFRFDGQVSGAPIPVTGLLVALQVRNTSGNWITARLARTGASGRFRIRYRFAPSRLVVRVYVPSQTNWFLYGGLSRTRTIRPR